MLTIMLVSADGSGCLTRPTLSNFPQGTRLSCAHLFPVMESLGQSGAWDTTVYGQSGRRKTLLPKYRHTD